MHTRRPLIPSFAVKVINVDTGRAVEIYPWHGEPTNLYQFVGGLEDGETGPLSELATYVDIGLIVLHWLIASPTGDLFVATARGYQSTRELIV